ncbi:MAG: aminoacyl-tRNA hydrolase [Thermoplasmata archaeon]|nr:aminoacyl-tRNA hydrolase [Thermoplasmata archaeon]
MALVLRGELRLSAGKSAVQAAHAAVMLVEQARRRDESGMAEWLAQGQKKIALVVSTLDEMVDIERRARARGIAVLWVEDAGFTEVAPGTRTCLGLGPALASELDPITGSLPLL